MVMDLDSGLLISQAEVSLQHCKKTSETVVTGCGVVLGEKFQNHTVPREPVAATPQRYPYLCYALDFTHRDLWDIKTRASGSQNA